MDEWYAIRTELLGQAILIFLASSPWYLAAKLFTIKIVKRWM